MPRIEHPAMFETARLTLRTLGPDSAALVRSHLRANREHLAPWEPVRDAAWFELDAIESRLADDIATAHAGNGVRLWLFVTNEPARIAGMVNIANVVRGAFLSCHLGYHLDARQLGHGYMTEAVQEAVRIAFDVLCLHRVEGNVIPRNTRSAAVLRRAGFECEGVSPRYLRIGGRWEDHEHFVALNASLEP